MGLGPKEGRGLEVKFPCTRKPPSHGEPRGTFRTSECHATAGAQMAKHREKSLQKCLLLPNITVQPANKWLTSLSPDQRVGAGS